MKIGILPALASLLVAACGLEARADVTNFSFSGPGVSGSGTLTYTPNASGTGTITGITGTFTDTNTGLNSKPLIVSQNITGLLAINPVVPLPANVTAPDFSLFSIANGVPSPPASEASTALSYDNDFYPNGSPIVCTDYPFSGGLFDVYGLLFSLSNGDVVGVWSNGILPGPPDPAMYGVAVADATNTYDYVSSGVTFSVPEPSTCLLMGVGAAALGLKRRRRSHG